MAQCACACAQTFTSVTGGRRRRSPDRDRVAFRNSQGTRIHGGRRLLHLLLRLAVRARVVVQDPLAHGGHRQGGGAHGEERAAVRHGAPLGPRHHGYVEQDPVQIQHGGQDALRDNPGAQRGAARVEGPYAALEHEECREHRGKGVHGDGRGEHHRGQQQGAQHDVPAVQTPPDEVEGRGACRDAQHEAGEDQAVREGRCARRGQGLQHGHPVEHKGVHGPLEEALHEAQEPEARLARHGLPRERK
mmetsp:Transcript_11706/g.40008  ORF Transcript_11706/g.40008 Transcript_11706/m.40008 type:complete len:246 (-) Transcript_11706:815-1552(-)